MTKIFILEALWWPQNEATGKISVETGVILSDLLYNYKNNPYIQFDQNQYYKIENRQIFEECISGIVTNTDVADNIIVDIECHGNNYGLGFQEFKTEPWIDISEIIKSLSCKRNSQLCVIVSACYSCGFAAFLHNNNINDVCKYLVCSCRVLYPLEATHSLSEFYKQLSIGESIENAFDIMNKKEYQNMNPSPYELFIFRS